MVLLVDLGGGHPPQDRVQQVVVAGDGGLRAAEHLGHHLIGQVVPQPEQHRRHRRGQRQHVRAAHRRLLPLDADDLPDPVHKLGELSGP